MKKVQGTEVNGAATIQMIVDIMLENSCNQNKNWLKQVKSQSEKLVKYIKLLDNPNNVKWSDI